MTFEQLEIKKRKLDVKECITDEHIFKEVVQLAQIEIAKENAIFHNKCCKFVRECSDNNKIKRNTTIRISCKKQKKSTKH